MVNFKARVFRHLFYSVCVASLLAIILISPEILCLRQHTMRISSVRSHSLGRLSFIRGASRTYQGIHLAPTTKFRGMQLTMQAGKTSSSSANIERSIVWFRNDLRIDDNLCLAHAAERKGEVLPVYCFDPRHFEMTDYGTRKMGIFRAKFLLEAAADLRAGLAAAGGGLALALGPPEDVLPGLCGGGGGGKGKGVEVLCSEEVTSEELAAEEAVADALPGAAALRRVWGSTLHHPDDLPMNVNQLPKTFTPWRTKVEDSNTKVRKPYPAEAIKDHLGHCKLPSDDPVISEALSFLPTLQDLGFTDEEVAAAEDGSARGVMPFQGGETAGLARLQEYLWGTDAIATYFETRNGMLGEAYSTKFSPWLALGCISPRRIYSELKKYEKQRVKNKSTYWVVFELLWRDYFRLSFVKHGSALFREYGLQGPLNRGPGQQWEQNEELFQKWVTGQTGWPLVDANMRELAATGWMSNRGRQNVGSFLCLDLQLDWRKGGYYFEQQLLDYDVCSNWGNWHAVAGLSGGRLNRFNIPKQSRDYDPQGEYIKYWIPELKSVPQQYIHEPWKMSKLDQSDCGVTIGVDYPKPVKTKPFFSAPQAQQEGKPRTGGNRRGGKGTDGRGRQQTRQ